MCVCVCEYIQNTFQHNHHIHNIDLTCSYTHPSLFTHYHASHIHVLHISSRHTLTTPQDTTCIYIIIITLLHILCLQDHNHNTHIYTYSYTSSEHRHERWTIPLKINSITTKQDRSTYPPSKPWPHFLNISPNHHSKA